MISVKCICGKTINIYPYQLKNNKTGQFYCSMECMKKSFSKSIEMKCEQCGDKIIREPNQIAHSKYVFCSLICKSLFYADEHSKRMKNKNPSHDKDFVKKRKTTMEKNGSWVIAIDNIIKTMHTPEFRKKRSLSQGGTGIPYQLSGYGPEFTKSLRTEIRERDNNKCQLCSKPQEEQDTLLPVHHIDYNKKNCSDVNLITLCTKCHAKTMYNRKYWEEHFTQLMISRIKIEGKK